MNATPEKVSSKFTRKARKTCEERVPRNKQQPTHMHIHIHTRAHTHTHTQKKTRRRLDNGWRPADSIAVPIAFGGLIWLVRAPAWSLSTLITIFIDDYTCSTSLKYEQENDCIKASALACMPWEGELWRPKVSMAMPTQTMPRANTNT